MHSPSSYVQTNNFSGENKYLFDTTFKYTQTPKSKPGKLMTSITSKIITILRQL